MKVSMKIYEKNCIEYCNRYKKMWEFFLIAKDAYLAGRCSHTIQDFDEVEVEFSEGSHQIGEKSVSVPLNEEDFKRQMKQTYPNIELFVSENEQTISFQGVLKI